MKKPTRDENDEEYEVGYCKPPKHTRFKPGQSGNPRGRPKRSKSFKTDVTEELREPIWVREGGRSRKVTKQRGIVKALVAVALKGNPKAVTLLNSMLAGQSAFDHWGQDEAHDDDLAAIRAALEELECAEEEDKERARRGELSSEEGDET